MSMDSFFDELTKFIDDNDIIVDETEYDKAMRTVEKQVLSIGMDLDDTPKNRPVIKRSKPIRVADNLIDSDLRNFARTETVFNETHLFTAAVNTTNTLEGQLSNVAFYEEDLIKQCYYTDKIVDIVCNYGRVTNPTYLPKLAEIQRLKKKKKQPQQKRRKKQGNGTEFGSQLTFTIIPDIPSVKPYKYKVFRPGKLQLPGAKMYQIDDVVKQAQHLAEYISAVTGCVSELTNIIAVMKNYKFCLKLRPRQIVKLSLLKELLNERLDDYGIFMMKYCRQDSKLAILFKTPTIEDPNKTARVNVFMEGKINILGAFDSVQTKRICQVLHDVFEKNMDVLIATANDITHVWGCNIEPVDNTTISTEPDDTYRQLIDEDNNIRQIMVHAFDELFASEVSTN